MNIEASFNGIVESMLEDGFVVQANNLKPRPSLLYLNAQINRNNVLSLVDTEAIHSFISPKLARDLGLLMK